MVNTKGAKILLLLSGVGAVLSVVLLQELFNIIDKFVGIPILIFIAFATGIYLYFLNYKTKDNNELANKNKMVVAFVMMIEALVCIGLIVGVNCGSVPGAEIALYSMFQGLVGDFLVNSLVFFKKEDFKWFKYLVLGEFAMGYISTAVLASYWIFIIVLCVIIICMIYADRNFLVISNVTFIIITIISISKELILIEDKERITYNLFIYISVLIIYLIFSITTIRSTDIIAKVNNDKINEIKEKQEKVRKMSDEIIAISKGIKEDAYSTNEYIDKLESVANDSLSVFGKIEQGNILNAESTRIQTDMTSNIIKMIDNVKTEVNIASEVAKNTYTGLISSNKSINGLKDKSGLIVTKNDEVINSLQEFMSNISKVKGIINEIHDLSEQTDLLALNASIESARAGVTGKGFAVVANEVISLADETAKLTDDIYKIIEKLERNSLKARKAIYEVIESVNVENEIIDETIVDFREMDENINKLSTNITNIFKNVENVVIHSYKIEEKSKELAQSSNVSKQRAVDAVEFNKDNKNKAEKTKNLMDELVNKVNHLDEFIAENLE